MTAAVAQTEPDPYQAQTYRFGLLEDFDHLYRYSAMLDRLEAHAADVQRFAEELEEKVAYVHSADVDYYTQAISDSQIEIVRTELEKKLEETEDEKVYLENEREKLVVRMKKPVYSSESIKSGVILTPIG